MDMSFNQRQRYLEQQKPPPWLVFGTWDKLIRHRIGFSYPTEKQAFSQNSSAYLRRTTYEEKSRSSSTKRYPCSDDGSSYNVSSVVAYSDITEENYNCAVDEEEHIQNIISKYIQGEGNKKASTKTTKKYTEVIDENDAESVVSQMSERRKECDDSLAEYGKKQRSTILCSRRVSLNEEQSEESLTQSFKKMVEGESFQQKESKNSPRKESKSSSKAPPFRKMEHRHSVDTKLRDQLLIEIQYGRDRLRSTPLQQKQVHLEPLTPREQLLQEIRIGKQLKNITPIHFEC
ncbi:hypothetical protein Gasu2_32920 [Galdieria sulphuraria]|uniref:WH2 domain-containing protein n=1 Tax=Galdieria sulphuraria TaxID=130081 RepID=M2XKF9_GALSU|nr:uncharacterized protein Gasu_20820 [Galdieria sulphuraria]EME30622.1 hypothetical protein Gasu_20820 [Galdieria sulphuraria]GJD09020.1 hypothetical protein Gasu2_32920 [Galdieria sulphuraria]|eukprot:XP_005707142.1 hypothetical protein Gasu_20820 [Galdieria sulphuraria]